MATSRAAIAKRQGELDFDVGCEMAFSPTTTIAPNAAKIPTSTQIRTRLREDKSASTRSFTLNLNVSGGSIASLIAAVEAELRLLGEGVGLICFGVWPSGLEAAAEGEAIVMTGAQTFVMLGATLRCGTSGLGSGFFGRGGCVHVVADVDIVAAGGVDIPAAELVGLVAAKQ